MSRKRIIKKTIQLVPITSVVHIYKAVRLPLPPTIHSLPEVIHLPKLASMCFFLEFQDQVVQAQLPLSTDLDLERDRCRSTEAGDLDLLEEARFWLFSGAGDLLTERDLLRLLLLDLV